MAGGVQKANESARLTAKQIRAAALVAEGELTEGQICQRLGMGRTTLTVWKRRPEFADEVVAVAKEMERHLTYLPIARKLERTRARNDRWQRGQEVIRQRAEAHKDVPGGGDTGFLVRDVKLVKVFDCRPRDEQADDPTPRFTEVETWAVDTGLLKELSDLETAVERSLGQQETGGGVNVQAVQFTIKIAGPSTGEVIDGG